MLPCAQAACIEPRNTPPAISTEQKLSFMLVFSAARSLRHKRGSEGKSQRRFLCADAPSTPIHESFFRTGSAWLHRECSDLKSSLRSSRLRGGKWNRRNAT